MKPVRFEVRGAESFDSIVKSREGARLRKLMLPYPVMEILWDPEDPDNYPFLMSVRQKEPGILSIVFRVTGENGTPFNDRTTYIRVAWSEEGRNYKGTTENPRISEEERERVAAFALSTVHSLVDALSCSNVRMEKHNSPKKPKTRWGKPPKGVDTYHILTVDVTATDENPEGNPRAGSPRRQHWRRGHIRRLKDGRQIWVQPHLAGDPERGFVDKDYQIKGEP